MLALEPGSLCDVCAVEYGPRNLPHSIACGHVLCHSCCTTIIEKTPRTRTPACPFCRDPFSAPDIRLVRIDVPPPSSPPSALPSGASTPRRSSPRSPRAPLIEDDFPFDLALKASLVAHAHDPAAAPDAARAALERKVALLAARKCSVDEIASLHREITDWLAADARNPDASSSLYLSALLLRAILANHTAFQDAAKASKAAENALKDRIDELQIEKGRLEIELLKQKVHTQKATDGQSLPRPKTAAPTSAPPLASRAQSQSPPSTRVSSPTHANAHTHSHASHFLPSLTRLSMSTHSAHAIARAPSTVPAPVARTPSTMAQAHAPLARAATAAPLHRTGTITTAGSPLARAPSTAPPRTQTPAAAHPHAHPHGHSLSHSLTLGHAQRSATPSQYHQQYHAFPTSSPTSPLSRVPTTTTSSTSTMLGGGTGAKSKTRTLSNPAPAPRGVGAGAGGHEMWIPSVSTTASGAAAKAAAAGAGAGVNAGAGARPMGPRVAGAAGGGRS